MYQNLIPEDNLAEAMSRKRYSCSVVSFFWGIDRQYETLGPHTLFLADDYEQNFKSIDRDLDLPANPSLYVHAPVRLDPRMAPPGEDTLIAVVPVGHLAGENQQDWIAIREGARRHVFRRLSAVGITDLETHIKFETSFTPLSWQKRYNLVKGATHGLSHNLMQLAYFRPSNRHRRYQKSVLCRCQHPPGHGPADGHGLRSSGRRPHPRRASAMMIWKQRDESSFHPPASFFFAPFAFFAV